MVNNDFKRAHTRQHTQHAGRGSKDVTTRTHTAAHGQAACLRVICGSTHVCLVHMSPTHEQGVDDSSMPLLASY